ncbi:hypothetical protein C8A00DRAFT_38900 [Chaetomidium leptoderma]|uniref:Uncharacterized protein n=1 Tax=Chaetomidium leptoderma TaxID=669021 RepID=A0AAN6ZSK5_9PEZI|nr:hypothetical protein C8A00DRAFT_38900 [Chaetomidium leptoderma]
MSDQTSTASTQPFTDSAESDAVPESLLLKHKTEANRPPSQARIPRKSDPRTPPPSRPFPPLAPAPLALPIQDLADAFASVSLATSPNARLVLACPTGSSPDGSGSVIIPLPTSIGGWDTVDIVQRTRDVDFVLDLPFWVQTKVEPPFELIPQRLKCRIYYDPVNDECLFVNESVGKIHLTPLTPAGDGPSRLGIYSTRVVSPGIWSRRESLRRSPHRSSHRSPRQSPHRSSHWSPHRSRRRSRKGDNPGQSA